MIARIQAKALPTGRRCRKTEAANATVNVAPITDAMWWDRRKATVVIGRVVVLSEADVLHYICRSVAYLLEEMAIPGVPSKFPTDFDQMTGKVDELAEVVRKCGR
jgi:hypothetical protein